MHSFTSKYLQFAFVENKYVYAMPHIVIALESSASFSVLQSRAHEAFALRTSSTMKDDPSYKISDTFYPFPFPFLLSELEYMPTEGQRLAGLAITGKRYEEFRAQLMMANNEGLTTTYNRLHDPAETSSGLLELRRLHGEMDQAVLDAYGWSDVPTACGFGLDYIDPEDDSQLPDTLQERIDSGELFFWDANDALDFQGQLQAYGAITGRRKLPWRYRWPDAVRDDVLARLLALNAERYEEEARLGLHSKGGKKAAKAVGAGGASGKRRGRPAKSAEAGENVTSQVKQMGLGL